jgi:acetolactate synthase-1/2/3 large subunit
MNGAQSLIRTLVGGGVDVCFANPGTSEMHFVASLDAVPQMRAVLALFEGVVTGAADGYGRMAERPGATLLHLGPGMANGLANLHNARRAHTPIVNVIGDHALYHKGFGAPLESDIESLTGWLHGWSRTSTDPMSVGLDAAEAIAAACTWQFLARIGSAAVRSAERTSYCADTNVGMQSTRILTVHE